MFSFTPLMSQKAALLFSLDTLQSAGEFHLQLLLIDRTARGLHYSYKELTAAAIRQHFGQLPQAAQKTLHTFSPSPLRDAFIRQHELSLAATQQTDNPEKRRQDFLLFALQQLQLFKPYFDKLSWYVMQKDEGGRNRIFKIALSASKPVLVFEAFRKSGRCVLQAEIQWEGISRPMSAFGLSGFFLTLQSDFILMPSRELKTLFWLQSGVVDEHAGDMSAFASNILQPLDANYSIRRGKSFQGIPIHNLPVSQILIREVNNQFLMLSPQWNYEGFIVSGLWKEKEEMTREGKVFTIHRHKEEEERFLRELQDMHPSFEKQRSGYYYLSFADAAKRKWFYTFFLRIAASDIELIGMDMLHHFRYSAEPLLTHEELLEDCNGLLTLRMQVSFGKEVIKLRELQKVLWSGAHALVLSDNSLGMITDEWLKQYGMRVKHGIVKSPDTLEVSKLFAVLEEPGETSVSSLSATLPPEWHARWKEWQTADAPLLPVPSSVNATLRPYQQKGYEWMSLIAELGAGVCLADDMGLGKTLQAICFVSSRIAAQPGGKHLIVCPASLIYNWVKEWETFNPAVSTAVFYGPRRDTVAFVAEQPTVIITSYSVVRNDIDRLSDFLFDTVVLDESHYIKTPGAQTTKAVNRLQARGRVIMSGTPLTNRTFDLYSQFHFLLPSLFSSAEFFRKEYAEPIDMHRDPEKTAMLRRLTAPFVLRRTKEQVATDLPAKVETTIWCTLSSEQRQVYDEVKSRVWDDLQMRMKNDGVEKSKLSMLQGLLKLRQVCNSPQLLKMDDYVVPTTDSVKIDTLLHEIENNLSDHKALIFSNFLGMLDQIGEELDDRGLGYFRIDGSVPPEKRMEMVNAFQSPDSQERFFLISITAGNAGLNLTAADYVFLVDPWWNRAVEQQAIDRTHRIGQQNSVFAYRMICKDTIEERILALQERKKWISDALISEEDGFVKSLDADDIAFLFS